MVGEYNIGLPHTSDLEMWLRLATVSDVGRVNRVVQSCVRVHPNSMQRTVNSGRLTDLVGRRDAFVSALLGVRERLSGAFELETTVRQRLAKEALDEACRAYEGDRVDASLENKLIEFAIATFPDARTLAEWHRLEKRRRQGRRSWWTIGSRAGAAFRRARLQIAYFRRLRTGI
jgi:hypothetical protein